MNWGMGKWRRENLTQKAGKTRKFGVFASRFLREKFTRMGWL